MNPEILEAEEFEILVKPLVKVAMSSLDLPFVSGRPRADELVEDAEPLAEGVEGVLAVAEIPGAVHVLETMVGLDDLGQIAKEREGLREEVERVCGGDPSYHARKRLREASSMTGYW